MISGFPAADRRVAVGCDSRALSEDSARAAAEALAENGAQVFLFDRPTPAPCLS